jgi:hypothetical protein
MWRCREKQSVFTSISKLSNGNSSLRIDGVAAASCNTWGARRSNMVSLVNDENVERKTLSRLRAISLVKYISQEALGSCLGEPSHAHDHPRVHQERVRMQTVRATHLGYQITVNKGELKSKLLAHLVLPLQGKTWRANNNCSSSAVSKKKFLNNKPCFDCLA